jgi:acid phosphatase class B
MTLSFTQIDPKFGLEINYPPVKMEHSYLEHLLRAENRMSSAQFWTGKLYDRIENRQDKISIDGVTSADLDRLQRQGKIIIFASGRTAYFADPATAEFIATRIYRHPSDAVAYGSLPVSEAQASTVISDRRAKLLVIDDEKPGELPQALSN